MASLSILDSVHACSRADCLLRFRIQASVDAIDSMLVPANPLLHRRERLVYPRQSSLADPYLSLLTKRKDLPMLCPRSWRRILSYPCFDDGTESRSECHVRYLHWTMRHGSIVHHSNGVEAHATGG